DHWHLHADIIPTPPPDTHNTALPGPSGSDRFFGDRGDGYLGNEEAFEHGEDAGAPSDRPGSGADASTDGPEYTAPDALADRAATLRREAEAAARDADDLSTALPALNQAARAARDAADTATRNGGPKAHDLALRAQHLRGLADDAVDTLRSLRGRTRRLSETAHTVETAAEATRRAPHSDEAATARAEADQRYQSIRHLLPPEPDAIGVHAFPVLTDTDTSDSDHSDDSDGEVLTGDDDVRNELGPAPLWHGTPREPGGTGMGPARRLSDSQATRWANGQLPQVSDPALAEAVSDYTGASYALIHQGLRHGNVGLYKRNEFISLVHRLDRAVDGSRLSEPVLVHKGVDSGFTDNLGIGLDDPDTLTSLVGTVHTEPSFISTSLGTRTPYDRPAYMMFRVPEGFPGLNAAPLSHAPSERELLLMRNSSFVIHAVYRHPGQRAEGGPLEQLWFIEAELVPHGWRPPPGWQPRPLLDAGSGYQGTEAPDDSNGSAMDWAPTPAPEDTHASGQDRSADRASEPDPDPIPGALGPDGVRRFASSDEGQEYGDRVLDNPDNARATFDRLPPEYRAAVFGYTSPGAWPYNDMLRAADHDDREALLEEWYIDDGPGLPLYELADPQMRPPTLDDIRNALTRTDLTQGQLALVEDIVSSADPAARLAELRDDSGNTGLLVDSFGRFPTIEDVYQRIHLIDQAIDANPLPEATLAHRALDTIDFLEGFDGSNVQALEGTVQTERGYLSTSLGADTGIPGLRTGPFHLHLTLPAGTKAFWLGRHSAVPGQRELLLPRETEYRITQVTRGPDGRVDIEAEVLLAQAAGGVDDGRAVSGSGSRPGDGGSADEASEAPLPAPDRDGVPGWMHDPDTALNADGMPDLDWMRSTPPREEASPPVPDSIPGPAPDGDGMPDLDWMLPDVPAPALIAPPATVAPADLAAPPPLAPAPADDVPTAVSPAPDSPGSAADTVYAPMPGTVGADGARRFATNEEGNRYGEQVLDDPRRYPRPFRALPNEQKAAVFVYTMHSWIYNDILRTPDEDDQQLLLEEWYMDEGPGWPLYDLLGDEPRRLTLADIEAFDGRDDLSEEQREIVGDILGAEDRSARLAEWKQNSGKVGKLVEVYGKLPGLEEIHESIGHADQAVAGAVLPEPLVAPRALAGISFMNGFDPNNPHSILGKEQTEPGFMSTSLGAEADLPEWDTPFHLHLTLPGGTRALWLRGEGFYEDESELLLPRGSTYVIDRIERQDGKTLLYGRLLPPGPAEGTGSSGSDHGSEPGESGDGWVTLPEGGRRWGRYGAAGLLLHSKDHQGTTHVLLQRRAHWTDGGGTWAIPGGARNRDETPFDAALREFGEEVAGDPGIATRTGNYEQDLGVWRYDTYTAEVADLPDLAPRDHESSELRWVPLHEVDSLNLLPGFRSTWDRIGQDLAAPADTGSGSPHRSSPEHDLTVGTVLLPRTTADSTPTTSPTPDGLRTRARTLHDEA
ncbi:ADP-ribosyltransferase, partial [Nocardiopsis sp. LOL_012]|uniref:ADP-ribosyltransferase n=1 Tax=Nocardiopsis sp. LOL_012 TaxID=3345409 RepID=UPI003A878618